MPDPDAYDEDEGPAPTEIQVDEDLATRLRDAQRAFDEVKEYLEDLKDDVKRAYADHDNVVGLVGREKIFTCVRRETVRIDSTRLKRDFPDIHASYAKAHVSQYLTVTRPKGGWA